MKIPSFNRIAHIGIEVLDIYTMELFYRKIGFVPIYRYVSRNTSGLRTVMLEKELCILELLKRHDNSITTKRDIFHISFKSNNIKSDFDRLKELKVDNLKPIRETGDGFLEFSFTDPEGNLIEVSQRKNKPPSYSIEAVIFDLDGTLIDSEENYYEADRRLLKEYGIDFTLEMKKEYIGSGNLEMMRKIKRLYKINDTVETLLRKKNSYYIEIARKNTRVYPEMLKFLKLLKKSNYPLAVASGSSPEILEELLTITGLKEYFSAIVSAEDVQRGKPAPDIFLESARSLNIPPENCVVIEDSQYGVEAAKRAFMYCIAIPYIIDKPLPDSFIMSDLLFENGTKSFKALQALHWIKQF